MTYTRNKINVWITVRRTSVLNFVYQIKDAQNIRTFLFCSYLIVNQRDHPCIKFIEKPFRTSHMFFLISKYKLVWHYVFTLLRNKYEKLVIESNNFDHVFDGPTIESKKIPVKRVIQMSSFMATVIFSEPSYVLKILYSGKKMFSNYSLVNNSLRLNKSCHQLNCVVQEAYWLKQTVGQSQNISLIHATYRGPKEPVDIDMYGGIAIYYFKDLDEGREISTRSYNMLSMTGMNKTFNFITEPDTSFVVIVHYYFSKFSLMTGELLLSKTSCAGKYIPINPCVRSMGFYELYLDRIMTPQHKCSVVIMEVKYYFERVFFYFKCKIAAHHVFLKNARWRFKADVYWSQIEVYNLKYRYNSQGNYTLFENLQENSVPIEAETHFVWFKPGKKDGYGVFEPQQMCSPNSFDEFSKIPAHYSFLKTSLTRPLYGRYDRLFSASSYAYSLGLKLEFVLNRVDFRSKWVTLLVYLIR